MEKIEPRNQLIYIQLIFDKDIKVIWWEKDSLSTKDNGTTGYLYGKRNSKT